MQVFEDAARARAAEANCLAERGHLCGALYLAGYVVECKLKILLGRIGRPFPSSGRAGHNLRGLYNAAGLRSSDLSGFKRAFLDYWSTSIRYSATTNSQHAPEDLLRGARDLSGYVTKRIEYARKPSREGRKP